MMSPPPGQIILRETLISVVINTALSIVFFALLFGWGMPVSLGALAADFFPQSFMIALMGALVPGLLVGRRIGAPAKATVRRSIGFAIGAAVLAGGAVFLVCRASAATVLTAPAALLTKAVYGAVLAAIVTPLALRRLFATFERTA